MRTNSGMSRRGERKARLTLGVLLEKLLLALLVGTGDDELVLVLDASPTDSGNGVLEARGQQIPGWWVAWSTAAAFQGFGHEHSHALAGAFDAVGTDEVELSSGDLDEFGVRWVT